MANLYDQIPTNGSPKAPSADGSQNNPLNTDFGRNVTNLASALPGAAAVPGAVGAGAGLAARAFGASAPAVGLAGRAAQSVAPYAPIAGGAAALNSAATASSAPPASPAAAPLAATDATNPADQRLAAGTQTAPAAPNLATAAGIVPGGYSRIDRPGHSPLFTDGKDPTMASFMVRGNGISSTNMAAADALAGSQHSESMGRVQAQIAAEQEAQRNSPQAMRQRALDILSNRGSRRTAESLMGVAAGMGREATARPGDALASQRSLGQLAIEQQKVNQAGESQGFANRAAAQSEQLRNVLLDPNATPAQRSVAQRNLAALSGNTEDARKNVVTLGGGQEWDAQAGAMRNVPQRAIDLRTGQEIGARAESVGQGGSPYKDGQRLLGKDGKSYVVKNGVPVLG